MMLVAPFAQLTSKQFFSASLRLGSEKMPLNGAFQPVLSLTVGGSEHRIAPLLTGPLSNILGLLFILSP